MKKTVSCIIFCLCGFLVCSQNRITGVFEDIDTNEQVSLWGFNGFETYCIDSTYTNETGSFVLNYSPNDYGMGYLSDKNKNSFFIILSGETIELKGGSIGFPSTIEIPRGNENILYDQYASEHLKREQTLSAWVYLKKIYSSDSLFSTHTVPQTAIENEIKRIKAEDNAFLSGLPQNSFISWYLPVRKLVSSVSTIAQYRHEEIPRAISEFRKINYTDLRMQKSGLLGQVIESHFWLIENSGSSIDSVYSEMNLSIDSLINNIVYDKKLLNEITNYLFKLLEQHSLFQASEYLALKVLNEAACTLDEDLEKQLESYRSMKIGNIAPNIIFSGDIYAPGFYNENLPKQLSELESPFILLVFAASWCPHCPGELSTITRTYQKWKNQGVEVVFISLDEDPGVFQNFASVFPFISICDYKKWNSKVVNDYHVFATPTFFLLDNNREILLRPNSATQMEAWVDWFLIQNKN
ncbi:MAG: TlpA family protein disulfide reductase [Gammaproteobacteria bacterium]|jgi:thiol-disulfide isomerase/thioredoxin|nr:TlpA family protein disulfide reductase [Gammaproteobacteria bacterium]